MKLFIRNISFALIATFTLSLEGISQNVIDEDLLDNIEINAKTLWTENLPAFTAMYTPEKYKDESAIILGYKRNVNIDKKSRMGFFSKGERSLIFNENIRFKIKLNDRNAVKSFTEVYFRFSDKEDGFNAKIIKPDGAEKAVSLNDAVAVESVGDVPEFYKSFFDQESGGQRRYYKVAIPDLEIGDILEYVTLTRSKLNVASNGYIEFSPQYEICNKKYPILFNRISIETDDKSFFKSMSYNGAPEFKKEQTDDKDFFRYVFTDNDRGTEKDVNFVNRMQVYPITKFQVIYANNANAKGALIGTKGEIKTNFSKEELAKKAWEDFEETGRGGYDQYMTVQAFSNALWAQLKKMGAKDMTEKEYINKLYYKLRNIIVYRDSYMSDKTFAFIFTQLLEQKDIKSDLIITASNGMGKIKDILFDNEIRYAVKVGNDLYFNPTDYSNPGELVESFTGNEAYIIKKPVKGTQEIIDYNFGTTNPLDNNITYVVNAAVAKDLNTLEISRTSTMKGLAKAKNISDALKYTPYMLDDYKSYGGDSPTENMNSRQEEDYYQSVKALKDNFNEAKPLFVKSELQGEYSNPVKYKAFSIGSDGRSIKKQDLVYTEEFDLSGMTRKAGKKYLVNIGALAGSQLQIKKEERVRKLDINTGYPRSFFWTINLKIPEGYTVDGLKELEMNIDNESGTFASTAEEKNGVVTFKIKKLYKKSNVSKEKWPEMLAFLDAAYNSTFRYILLKPKGG